MNNWIFHKSLWERYKELFDSDLMVSGEWKRSASAKKRTKQKLQLKIMAFGHTWSRERFETLECEKAEYMMQTGTDKGICLVFAQEH